MGYNYNIFMKNNRGFKKFLLRGLSKVSLEVGWLSLAHNLLKKAAVGAKNKEAKQIQATSRLAPFSFKYYLFQRLSLF
ncbi:hypothetical protein BC351_38065 [Paenibacillus ferrarius]|uniref:Transposase DDE domain-containing protein n=1 Tax=Paenibacillus ferrarius TaxID=1469647 RepID=A0A1V4HB47_9BACL|nr:hypothetical protein BC351_38065 [Paenibacillus ferrarius]